MLAQDIQLQNEDKSHCRFIGQVEAGRLRKRREAICVAKGNGRGQREIYRLLPPPPPPSESKETHCSVTLRDMNMAVGAQRLEEGHEQRDFERLVGYGLIAENARISERGYLRA